MRRIAFLLFTLLLVAPPQARASSSDAVESKLFTLHQFRLDSGVVLPELTLAYETYGTLAAGGRNAVLIEHSFTSSHHAAGFYAEQGAARGLKEGDIGWWDKVIGPGEAINTDRLFVISSNAIGSSYGSTSPASIDPKTGKPYGPDFPAITVGDIVRAQKALVDNLGVKHLVAVAGPSFGGFEAFQWAIAYPEFVQGVAAMFTAPYAQKPYVEHDIVAALRRSPNWNGGHYYDRGGVVEAMTQLRIAALERYGVDALLRDKAPNPATRKAFVLTLAREWARGFDANGMLTLLRAHEAFDARPQFNRIKAKVLYVLSRTDKVFPPTIAPAVMAALKSAHVDARYVEVDSNIGHLAFGYQTEKWSPALGRFIDGLTPAR